jgi:hypothetical protein
MHNPFEIGFFNIIVLIFAVLVRLVFALKAKADNLEEPFELKKYFDARHLIRWGGHLLTAFTLGLVVPELFLNYLGPKYLPDFTSWSFAGDFLLGFGGYDIIRFGEKITRPMVEKITGFKFGK